MAKKKQTDKKVDIVPEGVPAPYGIRKTFNHVVNIKKKRTNSLVKMKPLKGRQNTYEVPEFCPQGYSKTEFDLYREEYERIKQLTKQELKEILKINRQDTSIQSRAEVLNRCADGYALGRTPRCTHCYGSNPIYDKHKGTYFCPGYKEGDSFIKCQSTFTRDEFSRIDDWNNNFEQREAVRLDRTEKKLKHEREYQIQYKKAKKKRLAKEAREQKRKRGEHTSSSEEENDDNDEYNEKTEKMEATIKKQSDVLPQLSDDKIESERQERNSQRMESEREND